MFLSAWTTEWIGVHAIFGAFLAGVIIPRMRGITVELTHKIEDLVTIAFLPLVRAAQIISCLLFLLSKIPQYHFKIPEEQNSTDLK